jgi:CDP-diacylglycerol--serine O-phosphatidyltransferase
MLCGILAILCAVSGHILLAPWFIFAGAIFDFFDGFIARLLKQQGELGKQLDSLADMITFGFAPGMLMLVILIQATETGNLVSETLFVNWFSELITFKNPNYFPLIALIIPLMSMFRLAKFNIDTRQTTSFIGLPTPANSLFFSVFPFLITVVNSSVGFEKSALIFVFHPYTLIVLVVGMSLLLIAEIPLFALKFKQFHWTGNELRITFLISCLILIPVLWVWSIPIIVLLYIVLSIIEHYFIKHKQHEIQS